MYKYNLAVISILLFYCTAFSQGTFWYQTNLSTGRFDALAVDENNNIYAAGTSNGIVYRSADDGISWTTHVLPSATAVNSLTVSTNGIIFAGTNEGVLSSSNGGENWSQIGLTALNVLTIANFTEQIILAGTETQGIYRTTDAGTTWLPVGSNTIRANDILIFSTDSAFAANLLGGVYCSIDTGQTWTLAGLSEAFVAHLVKSQSNILYAATWIGMTAPNGVFRSTDLGSSWNIFWSNTSYSRAEGMIVNSAEHVYLSTSSLGVFRSRGSDFWENVNSGLPGGPQFFMEGITINRNGVLFLGSYSNGVFKSTPMVVSVENTSNRIIGFHLMQNFPNPFNPSTKINYSIPQDGLVILKVYDVLGNEITTLVNEEKPVGIYELNFDAKNLSSGVYLYRIQAGNFSETKKFILLK